MSFFSIPVIALASALSFSNANTPVAIGGGETSIQLRTDAWKGRQNQKLQTHLFAASQTLAKLFPNSEAAAWDRLNDGSLLCSFRNDGHISRAYFAPHGRWLMTIENSDGRSLPVSVAADIRSVYGEGTDILSADAIRRPGTDAVYLVVIKTGQTPHRIRVDNDGIETLETFQPMPTATCPVR